MRAVVKKVMVREFMLAVRSLSQVTNPLYFFTITIILFPLSMSPDSDVMQVVAPGIVWMAALFSIILSIDRIFVQDIEDGIIEQWLLSQHNFSFLIVIKILSHWLLNVVPLILLSPLFALLFNLSAQQTSILALSLLLGTPTILLIAALAAAFTATTDNKGMLMALIVFPVIIPVIIFGAGCLIYASQLQVVLGLLALLAAILLLALIGLPFAIASALRISLAY